MSLSRGEWVGQHVEKIFSELKDGKHVAVVVSAMGNITDILIKYSKRACKDRISPKELDEILSMGERTSARLFTAALKTQGIEARYLDPADDDWPLITDDTYGNANPLVDKCICKIRDKLEPLLNENIVPVIPGFIGKTVRGEVTTLGRGGSDTTAFLVAKAIGADEVVLISNVNGIMSADPKIVPNPKIIKEVSVEKLMNICDFSNKFLHKKALSFLDGSFKVKIASYRNKALHEGGTIIQGAAFKCKVSTEKTPLAAITIITNESSNLSDVVHKVSEIIMKNGILVLMFLADADALILIVPDKDLPKTVKILHSNVLLNKDIKVLSIAVKRGIVWTKVSWVDVESIYKEMEILKLRGEKLFGTFTIASNLHFLTEQNN